MSLHICHASERATATASVRKTATLHPHPYTACAELPSMRRMSRKREKMYELNAKICVLGDISVLPEDIRQDMLELMEETAGITDSLLNVCVNYGARQEIVQAVNKAVSYGRFVDEASFSSLLSTAGLPDPDLIIRTGGELRLSNFLLYQAAYSELYFSNKMWPEFSRRDLEKAIESYSSRDRRFGNVREE